MATDQFTGVQVFTSTKREERNVLGERVSQWLAEHRDIRIVDKVVTQSSDSEFHCLTITIFYSRA